jgi:hypothetical protein
MEVIVVAVENCLVLVRKSIIGAEAIRHRGGGEHILKRNMPLFVRRKRGRAVTCILNE